MVKIKLYSRHLGSDRRDKLDIAYIPPFTPMPDVVIYGDKHYMKLLPGYYIECFAAPVIKLEEDRSSPYVKDLYRIPMNMEMVTMFNELFKKTKDRLVKEPPQSAAGPSVTIHLTPNSLFNDNKLYRLVEPGYEKPSPLWQSLTERFRRCKPTPQEGVSNMEDQNKTMNELLILRVAFVCHQANKAWCSSNGDNTQKDWDDAEQWQRDSMVKGVKFRLEKPNCGLDGPHNSWLENKAKEGWVYGPVKDAVAKTHPCIMPYDQLPDTDKKKDLIFVAIVDALIPQQIQTHAYEPMPSKPPYMGSDPVDENAKIMEYPVKRELTFGERAVGLTFNHGEGDVFHQVNEAKVTCAKAIDQMDALRSASTSGEYKALATIACRKLQSAQMDMVKAITWKD